MQLENQTDHIAMLSLMLVGVLVRRMSELGQIDEATAVHIHKLAENVRRHAGFAGLTDLKVLFENIDHALGASLPHDDSQKINAAVMPQAM